MQFSIDNFKPSCETNCVLPLVEGMLSGWETNSVPPVV